MFSQKWRRIILDEAHNIRNPQAKASLAALEVQAESKWALTGTPIVNTLKDLYSLIRFLGLSGGLDMYEVFSRCFTRPIEHSCQQAITRLQALMGSICLRRKKDMKFVKLGIPELQEFIYKVKFSTEEKAKYNILKYVTHFLLVPELLANISRLEAEGLLMRYELARDDQDQKSQRKNTYNNLLERLLRMRQICNHTQLCGADRIQEIEARLAEIGNEGPSDEMRSLLQEILQLAIDSQEDCPICLDVLHNPRITICRHVFGFECLCPQRLVSVSCPS